MSINERIKLNKLEYYDLLKSYLNSISEGISVGYFNISEIKLLLNKLKEYKKELEIENEYLNRLKGINNPLKEDEVERILELIDQLNKSIYLYYDEIGDNYPYPDARVYPLGSRRNVKTLSDDVKLLDQINGVLLTKEDIKKYFNYSDGLSYAYSNAKIINALDNLSFYGVTVDDDNGIIRGARMIVPPVIILQTALVNVHEIRNIIDLYELIGKKYPDNNDFEVRAREEENKFIREYLRNK